MKTVKAAQILIGLILVLGFYQNCSFQTHPVSHNTQNSMIHEAGSRGAGGTFVPY